MYISGVPKKLGLYWVKMSIGWTDFFKPMLMELEETFNVDESVILVWRRLKDNSAFPATGKDLYWDEQVLPPKEYECLRRIDELQEKQEDIE